MAIAVYRTESNDDRPWRPRVFRAGSLYSSLAFPSISRSMISGIGVILDAGAGLHGAQFLPMVKPWNHPIGS